MIYLLTGIVRILFAFVEGIVKLVLYLLRVFGLIVPAIYLLVMFAVNLATDNAVLESYYPLFVSGLCLSMVGAVLLFFRNTVKNPIKAVRVNRKAKELDRYEQELIAREQHMNELEQRCMYLEQQLAQAAPAGQAVQQSGAAPRFEPFPNGAQAPYSPGMQPVQPQAGMPLGGAANGSAPASPAAYSVPSNAGITGGAAPQSYAGGQAPYSGAPSGFAPSAPVSYPAGGQQIVNPAYGSAPTGNPHASGYPEYGLSQEPAQTYAPERDSFGASGFRTAQSGYGRSYDEPQPNERPRRRGLFGRREEGAPANGGANRACTAPPRTGSNFPDSFPDRGDSAAYGPFASSEAARAPQPAQSVPVPADRERPEIFRVRQDPRYLVYDYSDRRELYLETAQGLEFIKTDYKRS